MGHLCTISNLQDSFLDKTKLLHKGEGWCNLELLAGVHADVLFATFYWCLSFRNDDSHPGPFKVAGVFW